MFLKVLIPLALLAVAVGTLARPSGGAGRPQVYVVKPADTLWSIASSHYAGDPRASVWKLERRNRLVGTTIVPGERLVLP
ncbi:MAG TPA: LysM peptidoglycan-binding domain-containing protein [Gaiellaceae bacterium]|jgi:LysM repeat protein|nr:LysM peptidoglycan-binding domain-containing protein [Gaiellaceae bacterium]